MFLPDFGARRFCFVCFRSRLRRPRGPWLTSGKAKGLAGVGHRPAPADVGDGRDPGGPDCAGEATRPPGFGLPPRLVAAFCAHPAWARDYLRCATFEAWLAAADDPALAELPPPPAPWPISGGARARALPVPPLQ